jgi:hypothetical protein
MRNKTLFDDKYHIYERNALLRKFKSSQFIGLKLEELINKVLSIHSEIKFNLYYISFKKLCNVHYSINLVLDNYLKQNGINDTIMFKEDLGYIYVDKNRLFAGSAANAFMEYLKREHGTIQSIPDSLKQAKNEFIKHYRKYFLFSRVISIVTVLFIISVIVAIFMNVFNLLEISI